MTILLPILTFAVIIGIQYLVSNRWRRTQDSPAPSPALAGAPEQQIQLVPQILVAVPPTHNEPLPQVHGYALPEPLYYHQGHSWVWVQDAETAFVGIDDFARRMVGSIRSLNLPRIGAQCHQGETGWTVKHNGRKLDMLFPVDGEIVAVNTAAQGNPEVVSEDPYGKGWLAMVRTSDLKRNLRNLLYGPLARKWMEESSDRLKMMFAGELGPVYQDGDQPAESVINSANAKEWKRIVEELFLVKP